MRAAIYDPYLDTLGGGERYTLSFAKILADFGWEVFVGWKDERIKSRIKERFGLDLKNIRFVPDIQKGKGYDLCFWVSDGSVPLLSGRKNILHFQVPFHDVDGKSLFNKMKFFRIDKVVCNSGFTKKVIDREYGINSQVIYPPVDVARIKSKRKENLILYVGRFSELVQSKRQDILIEVFKKFSRDYPDWKLVLAGGSDVGAAEYVAKLKKQAKGQAIEILEGIDYKSLLELYGKARFFWSAAGFGINEKIHPEQIEHFGITTIEAMAAGVVCLVLNTGGSREIIEDNKNGFFWSKEKELIKRTEELIKNKSRWGKISGAAKERSELFGYERFNQEVLRLIA